MMAHCCATILVYVICWSQFGLTIDGLHIHELNPSAVTDNIGNTANESSVIVWAALPLGQPYLSDTSCSNDGLQPLYNFANDFIDTVQKEEFPYDLLKNCKADSKYISKHQNKFISYEKGFLICIVIALIFVVVISLTGIVFSCCLCQGHCGVKVLPPTQDHKLTIHVMVTVFVILNIFLVAGMICSFSTNEKLTNSVTGLESSVIINLNDMNNYMQNTITELDQVTLSDYNFTVMVLQQDLNNRGYLLGLPVKTMLGNGSRIDDSLMALLSLDLVINEANNSLTQYNNTIARFKNNGKILQQQLLMVKNNIEKAKNYSSCFGCSNINTNVLNIDFNFDQLPNISSHVAQLNAVAGQNLTLRVNEAQNEFDDIPALVFNNTENIVTELEVKMSQLYTEISQQLKSVQEIPQKSAQEIVQLQVDLDDYHTVITHYNNIRWAVGTTLVCMILLIIILQVCGLLLGLLSYSCVTVPTEWSRMSHTGGKMLLSAAGLIFLFAGPLMLLTTLSLVLGGNMEKLFCEPLSEPNSAVFIKIFDTNDSLVGPEDGYFLSQLILQNKSIDLEVNAVLRQCEMNQAAYGVMKLSYLIDLDALVTYNNSLDIDLEINSINIDLSSVELLTPAILSQMTSFMQSLDIDFVQLQQALSRNITSIDLQSYANSLNTAAQSSLDPAKDTLTFVVSDLEDLNNLYATLLEDQRTSLYDLLQLSNRVHQYKMQVLQVLQAINSSQNYIRRNGSSVVKEVARKYALRLQTTLNSFVSHATFMVENEVGRCRPIWNLWQSVVNIGFCNKVVDTFNGFWVAIGWCIFIMMPCIILNVKLAKYLCFKKYQDNYNEESASRNKVSPSMK